MTLKLWPTIAVIITSFLSASAQITGIPDWNNYSTLSPDSRGEKWLMDSTHIHLFMTQQDSVVISKEYMYYNEFGLMDSMTMKLFSLSTMQWEFSTKVTYTYNDFRVPLTKTSYLWLPTHEVWVPDGQRRYTYIPGDTLVAYINYLLWEDQGEYWRNHDSTVFARDPENLVDSTYKYHWKTSGGYYEFTSYRIYVYNDQDLLINDTSWHYMELIGWHYQGCHTYTYNAAGLETEYIMQGWDEDQEVWVNAERYTYTYNANMQMTLANRFVWDAQVPEWHNYEKYYYTYDADGNLDLLMFWELDEDLELWQKVATYELFWSLHYVVDMADNYEANSFEMFPNPASDLVYIMVEEKTRVRIYTLQGQLIRQDFLTKGLNTLDCRDLKPGIYLLQSSASGNISKLIMR